MASKHYKSVVPDKPTFLGWKYFCDFGDGIRAFCLLCAAEEKDKLCKACSGMTEGLKKHLKIAQEQIWKEIDIETKKRKEEKASEVEEAVNKRRKLGIGPFKPGDNTKNQPTVKQMIDKFWKVDPAGAVQKKYDEALVEMLSSNFLSFNLVESSEFHSFVMSLNKTINLKSRYFYSNLTAKYSKEIIEEVKKLIEEYTDASLAITTDIWTSRTQDGYISLTVHFVDKLFRLHR